MTTYKIRLVYDKMYGKKMPTVAVLPSGYGNFFKDVDVPITFDSLTKSKGICREDDGRGSQDT